MMQTSKDARALIEKYLKTEKQKSFRYDFFVDESKYEKWEDVKIGQEGMAERSFEVKMEDILAYLDGTLDNNPLFRDEEFAKKTPWGGLVAPPLLLVPIIFWCTGTGSGSWIRTPGAINPGQKIEFYEPIRVGDTITIKAEAYDKYVKRGKKYLTYLSEFRNQRGQLVAKWWGTLILPTSRSDEKHRLI